MTGVQTCALPIYAGYLATALVSLFDNASDTNVYDIVILEDGMDDQTKFLLASLSHGIDNCYIRFFPVSELVRKYNATDWEVPHFLSLAAYYRLFIPLVACHYPKVIYLDCDVLLQSDIASLLAVELGECSLAGVIDPNCEIQDDVQLREHLCGDLGLRDISNYINSGVLLFNIEVLLVKDMPQTFFDIASKSKGFFGDQDVLNVACEDSILFLDSRWNVFWGLTFERHKMRNHTDDMIDQLLHEAFLVHYAGEKPVQRPNAPLGAEWWASARKTPFYESLLKPLPARPE